jgi:hypothetical protein
MDVRGGGNAHFVPTLVRHLHNYNYTAPHNVNINSRQSVDMQRQTFIKWQRVLLHPDFGQLPQMRS